MKKTLIYTLSALLISAGSFAQKQQDYKNPSYPVEHRVQSLLNQMTLEEKISQMPTPLWKMDNLTKPN